MSDKTCLSYWFPKLQAAGLPVPRTEIVCLSPALRRPLFAILDGELHPETEPFFSGLRAAVEKIGTPCFLRTGQTSGKHEWGRTCYVQNIGALVNHVGALIEFSECADMLGLPWDVWVVRELLPTKPLCRLPMYSGFPLVPETRCFIEGGDVRCSHPYWPRKAIEQGFPFVQHDGPIDWDAPSQRDLPLGIDAIVAAAHVIPQEAVDLASRVASVFNGDGAWSVDILPTERGWHVTDMAEAHLSFHWEGCEHEQRFRQSNEPQ